MFCSSSNTSSSSRVDSLHRSSPALHPLDAINIEPANVYSVQPESHSSSTSHHLGTVPAPETSLLYPTYRPVSKLWSVESDKAATQDPQLGPNRRSKQRQKWQQPLQRTRSYIASLCNTLARHSKRDSSFDDDDWVKTISIIFQDTSGKEVLRYAKAKFDTGNPKNLISPTFAARFGLIFEPHNAKVILDLPGNGQFVSIGKIAGRWCSKINAAHDRYFRFDPKFMDAEFEVSNSAERFDIVIGADTIKLERLLEWGPALALTGFRSSRPPAASGNVPPVVLCTHI
jgi:hypothetical protein